MKKNVVAGSSTIVSARALVAWLDAKFPVAPDAADLAESAKTNLVKRDRAASGRLAAISPDVVVSMAPTSNLRPPFKLIDGGDILGQVLRLPSQPTEWVSLTSPEGKLFGASTPAAELSVDITSLGGWEYRVDVAPAGPAPTAWPLTDKELGLQIRSHAPRRAAGTRHTPRQRPTGR